MANDLTLGLRIRVNDDGTVQVLNRTNQGLRDISTSAHQASNAMDEGRRSFSQTALSALSVGDAARATAAGFSIMALAAGGKELIQLADKMTLLDARIKIATSSAADYVNASKELVAISLRTGTSFESNATIFSRINKAMEGMGGSIRHTTALTETLAQTMRISGVSTEEAASTVRQMSQALASGLLRGDEFNSIMENAPRLAQALADGMHVSIGALRAMAEAGELNSKRVIEAIQSQRKTIDDEFKHIPLTVGTAMTNISTAFGQYVMEANKGAGATAGLAQNMNAVANNLTPIIDGIVTLGKISVTVFAGQMVGSLTAYIVAQRAAASAATTAAAAVSAALIATETEQAAAAQRTIQTNVALAQSNLEAANMRRTNSAANLAATVAERESAIAQLSLELSLVRSKMAQARATIAATGATQQDTNIQHIHQQAVTQLARAEQERTAILAQLAVIGREHTMASLAATEATTAQAAAQTALTISTSTVTGGRIAETQETLAGNLSIAERMGVSNQLNLLLREQATTQVATTAMAANARVAETQANLAGNLSIAERMALGNRLNIQLREQTVAQTALTAQQAAAQRIAEAAAASLTTQLRGMLTVMGLLNVAMGIFVAFEVKNYLEGLYTGSDFAAKSMGALATWIEEVSRRFALLKAVFTSDTWDEVNAASDQTKQSYVNLTNEMLKNNAAARNHISLSGEMQAALEEMKSPQEVYNQKIKEASEASKTLNADTKQMMITEEQRLFLGKKALEAWEKANAAEADTKKSEAGKEIEKLKDQYDKLTLSTEAYNKKHADGLKGTADEIVEVTRWANAVAKLEDGKKSLTKTSNEAASESKKAAKEEADFWTKSLGFLKGQAEKLNLLKLSNKEQALETEISRNLNTVLGETYDKTQSLSVAKQQLVDEVVSNTRQIYAETEAIAQQQAMWDESVKQANALTDLRRGAEDAQSLANMAKTLSVMGATNEEVAKRITLEQKLRGIVSANPDLNEQQVRDYVIAEQRAADEIAQYTNAKTEGSAKWMEAAFKKAAENIQDSFATMFENMLNGDATASFSKFAENIKKTLNQAISQQLSLDLQNLFTGKGGLGDTFKSALLFGVSMITSLLSKTATRTYSPSETGNSTVTGTGAMHIADSFARDQGFAFQSKTIMAFNKSLDFLSSSIMSNTGKITDWIGSLGSKLTSITVFNQVANFFKPVTSVISAAVDSVSLAYSKVTDFLNYGITAVTDLVGLTSKTTVVVDAISTSAAGTGTAADAAGAAASAAEKVGMTALQKVNVVLAVIKLGYDVFVAWSNDAATTHTKITQTFYAAADALASMALLTLNPAIAIAYAVVNTIGVISDVIENGFSRENVMRFFFGPLSGLISSLIWEPRVPNVWMNTYNPDQSSGRYISDPNASTYTATGNKSAYVGESTPFGMTVISTHEMSLSAQDMVNAFGGLLKTVKTVDINLYNTIMRLDTAMGQAGKTMDFYNNLLKDGSPGKTSVSSNQNASDLNAGQLIADRYTWIIDQLAASGSVVGQYINAWFDVITSKFIAVSKDNSMFVLGVINSLATNIESFMQFPLALVNLIGQSVKSISSGGTPDTVMAEIADVFNTYQTVKNGMVMLGLGGDTATVNEGIVRFLSSVNSMGYAVKDAGVNLLAYAIAIQKTGALGVDAMTVLNAANAKLSNLKVQGFDNTQITAYLGSFGLMANLFSEANVSFSEADLDSAAKNIHKLSQASVDVAKNVVDHAIADAQLTTVTRAAAIATLVKNKTLDEATVAEAEYGLSIQKNTKAVLDQMSFVQQLGYLSGKTLGEMSISATTWQSAANNVVAVFGDMATAMSSLDDIAKTFMSAKDYAQYNLDTINRGIANMQSANSALTGITASSITTMIKNGTLSTNMINGLASGLGESSTEALAYIKLIGQQLTAQTALANAINNTTAATNGQTDAQIALMNSVTKTARDNLTTAYKNESAALTTTINKFNDFTKSLKAFRDGLTVGDLSTSTPLQKYKDTGDQYRATLSTINAGAGTTDASKQAYDDAMGSIQAKATAFLSASRDYNASSTAYKTDYSNVLSAIGGLITTAGTSKTTAETALTTLTGTVNEQVKGLTTINDSVLSVKDAIFELNTASFAWIKGYLNIDDKTALADTIKTWQSWFYTYLDDKSGGQLTKQNGVLGVSGNSLLTPSVMVSDYFDNLVNVVNAGVGTLPDFMNYINQAMAILTDPQIVIRNQGAPYIVDPLTGNLTPAVDPGTNAEGRKSPDKKTGVNMGNAIADMTDQVSSIPNEVLLWFKPKANINSTVIGDMKEQVDSIPNEVKLWLDTIAIDNIFLIGELTAQVNSIPNEIMLSFAADAVKDKNIIDGMTIQTMLIPNEIMLSFTRDIKHNDWVIDHLIDQVNSIPRVVPITLAYTTEVQPTMPVMGPSPLPVKGLELFAKGGIADRPSIFGEAGPEAAVPLPDGRSIPVTLSQSVGRSDNTDIIEQLKAALTEQQKQNAVLQQALRVMQAGFSQLVARSDEQQQTLESVERQLRRQAA